MFDHISMQRVILRCLTFIRLCLACSCLAIGVVAYLLQAESHLLQELHQVTLKPASNMQTAGRMHVMKTSMSRFSNMSTYAQPSGSWSIFD